MSGGERKPVKLIDRDGKFVAVPIWFVEGMGRISKGSTLVYLALRHRAGIHLGVFPASMNRDGAGGGLLDLTGMSRTQIYQALQELRDLGLIERNGVGVIIKKREEIDPSSPAGGILAEKPSPVYGTDCPAGGTDRPTGGTNRPAGGTPSSLKREREGEGECPATAGPPSESAGDQAKDFLVWFSNRYEEETGNPYPITWEKEKPIVARLLRSFGRELLQEMALELLRTGDQFIREKMGRSLGALSSFSVKFSEAASRKKKAAIAQERSTIPPSDYEKEIRIRRLREHLQELEEKYGEKRARELHDDLFAMVEAMEG
jgi:hypothetical protein